MRGSARVREGSGGDGADREDALKEAPLRVAARDLGAVLGAFHKEPQLDVLRGPDGRLVIINKGGHL
jgi:hypothetical protein